MRISPAMPDPKSNKVAGSGTVFKSKLSMVNLPIKSYLSPPPLPLKAYDNSILSKVQEGENEKKEQLKGPYNAKLERVIGGRVGWPIKVTLGKDPSSSWEIPSSDVTVRVGT
jgi:hypothetical protein